MTLRELDSRTRRWIAIGVVAAIAVCAIAFPFLISSYALYQFNVALVLAVGVLGLNLLTGYAGQISLGHNAFFAFGAYTFAILWSHGVNYVVALVPAFAVAMVVGFVIGLPALRLKGLYLAIVTVGLAITTEPLINRLTPLTGGPQGLIVIQPAPPDWTGLTTGQWLWLITAAIAVAVFVMARNLVRGRVGRALIAIRENEVAGLTMGVDVAAYKTGIFALSGGLAGLAGALYALVVGFVGPGSFTLIFSIFLLVAMVIGGLGTVMGALVGATVIEFLPTWASGINQSLSSIIYAAALILLMMVARGGLIGLLTSATVRVLRQPKARLFADSAQPRGAAEESTTRSQSRELPPKGRRS
jgi:branched-chain amino acid transport system permease protein